jgi:thiamine biosynthesis lipoprotein
MTAGPTVRSEARLAEAEPPDRRLARFETRSMGSPLRLSIVVSGGSTRAHDAVLAARAWLHVRREFEACDRAMSRFLDTSEITRLNRQLDADGPVEVSPRLRRALTTSDRAQRLTDGRFDPRVLRDLERLGDRGAPLGHHTPGYRPRRPWGRVVERVAGRRFRLACPVDLGGIGKGLALRWAAAAVVRLGVEGFLLEAGGDLVTRGEPPEGGPWLVGLENPAGAAEPLAVLTARGGAVATTSVRRRRWTSAGREVHHLIDPRTGEPGGAGLLAVTVAGPDPAWAEIWSKTLFLAGHASIAAVARQRGLAAWWVADDGSLEMTAAARQRTSWVAGEGG